MNVAPRASPNASAAPAASPIAQMLFRLRTGGATASSPSRLRLQVGGPSGLDVAAMASRESRPRRRLPVPPKIRSR